MAVIGLGFRTPSFSCSCRGNAVSGRRPSKTTEQESKWAIPTFGILIPRTTGLVPVRDFLVNDMSNVENLFVTLDSRVCGNPHGLIRKYALMCCRQCFRSNAKEIGFIKDISFCTRFPAPFQVAIS
ncbi:40S ribosomal protein S29 isoform X1 [Prunus yedoensis var. nudiflora]|uniref:40S ribosomal protein S29 isoform X1 n=1 Tax=Prunus yedoensis var. nudiflora TaxID=2094558 RepID=A0A314XN04_PRUYE|nr:40S ribosomal protein S29 isoform X1 [Prunus yedoensis var. nudiflora]